MHSRYAVVGGGIIGAAVTRQLLMADPDARVTLIEKEPALGRHQTGHNSGVAHAGLYYQPGSLKARLCRRGVALLARFCAEHAVAYRACGKVLVALDSAEEARLRGILDRARANGVPGVRMLDARQLRDLEPHVRGVAGLHSPTTAIVDFPGVTRALGRDAAGRGATIRTGTEVTGLATRGREVIVSASGFDAAYDRVVVCAGLHADRVARLAGDGADPMIVPFRGEYFELRPERRHLVRGNVYPVPDPRYPFLGLHATPRTDGRVVLGPNAVLALAREGYGWRTVVPADLWDYARWPGMRRFARRHWRTAVREVAGSVSRRRFVAGARRYLPELTVDDVVPGPSGVRAQALDRAGELVDDFRVHHRGRVTCLRNAPSPAATSALAIAEHLVTAVLESSPG